MLRFSSAASSSSSSLLRGSNYTSLQSRLAVSRLQPVSLSSATQPPSRLAFQQVRTGCKHAGKFFKGKIHFEKPYKAKKRKARHAAGMGMTGDTEQAAVLEQMMEKKEEEGPKRKFIWEPTSETSALYQQNYDLIHKNGRKLEPKYLNEMLDKVTNKIDLVVCFKFWKVYRSRDLPISRNTIEKFMEASIKTKEEEFFMELVRNSSVLGVSISERTMARWIERLQKGDPESPDRSSQFSTWAQECTELLTNGKIQGVTLQLVEQQQQQQQLSGQDLQPQA